jgi:uncharacterized protein (TIGR03118 family)
MKRVIALFSVAAFAVVVAGSALAAAPPHAAGITVARGPSALAENSYRLRRLVADQPGHAAATDPNLVNAWGLAAGPTTPWWVANADSDTSTLYDGTGAIIPLIVDVPGGPTGLVFNGGTDFVVSDGMGASAPSLFLFATESGTIRGWNSEVPLPSPSTQTFVVADQSGDDANYKGLAIASTADGDMLYAADFHNARVDVFDGDFTLVSTSGTFVDPGLPDGFAPFGIQAIGDTIFVTYAKQDADAEDEVTGKGRGFVDAFDTAGAFLGRVATRNHLNAPWGLAMAPTNFGRFSGALLVGNFGDGLIHAFRQKADGSWRAVGAVKNANGRFLRIDGLWSLQFGNDDAAGASNQLYFTAGPDDEAHGLFGKIRSLT